MFYKLCIILLHERLVFTFALQISLNKKDMSRVYQTQPGSTTRRAPAARPPAPAAPTSTTRGARAPVRGRTMRTQPPRPQENDNHSPNEGSRTREPERTVHVGLV